MKHILTTACIACILALIVITWQIMRPDSIEYRTGACQADDCGARVDFAVAEWRSKK